MNQSLNRREFIASSGVALLAASGNPLRAAEQPLPIIDIHQHPGFKGRPDEKVLAHQRAMGVSMSFILPAGTPAELPSTNGGKTNGLAAGCSPADAAQKLAQENPGAVRFFANEPPDHPDARKNLEKFLQQGAIGIGEQKFKLPIDSSPMRMIYDIAKDFGVPVLMHFQHGAYNLGFERFHKMLEKYPTVNFIGHAQTFWGNIDGEHVQKSMYPKGPVKAGGITDRLLADYPNMYGDHSAGSGRNALIRDEEHAQEFLRRHQDKLMFGSDCYDTLGRGPSCRGANLRKTLEQLAPTKDVLRKILFGNANRLFKLGL